MSLEDAKRASRRPANRILGMVRLISTVSAKDKSTLPNKVSRVSYLLMIHLKREIRDSPITIKNRI